MLIGISGNICSGKSEVAKFLKLQGFVQIHLKSNNGLSINVDPVAHPINPWPPANPLGPQQMNGMPLPLTTIPGTPLRPPQPHKETKLSGEDDDERTMDDDEDDDDDYEPSEEGDDDDDDDDDESDEDDDDDNDDGDGGPSASVKKLIHELTDLTMSENERIDMHKPQKLDRAETEVYPYTPKLQSANITPSMQPHVPGRVYPYSRNSVAAPEPEARGSFSNGEPAHTIPIHALKAGSMAHWNYSNVNGEGNGMFMGAEDDDAAMTFSNVEEILDYVTHHWQTNFVTTDILSLSVLEILSKRPFFLHIAVDAPVALRWTRFSKRLAMRTAVSGCSTNSTPSTLVSPQFSLESFVMMCDKYMYSENGGMAAITSRAKLTIMNHVQSLELLYVKLSKVNLLDPLRLRPSWDTYFTRLANLAALRSNCMKRQVGCVLVRDKRVIATGYNGTPRGLKNCNEGGCERCNDNSGSGMGLGTCVCLHAEENALLESGRDRIGEGSILYCNTCPCLTCSIKIVQSGIREVVYLQPYSMDRASEKILRNGNVILRQFIPPSEGLVI